MNFELHLIPLVKVIFSLLLGGLIGFERELASKPAGLRTHMLVAGSATLFVILGNFMVQQFTDTVMVQAIQSDPIRVMEAIITGISFLGAGTIIFKNKQESVEGLTTAASILFVSAIGITVALDQLGLATILTVIVIVVLMTLGYIERRIENLRRRLHYKDKDKDKDKYNPSS